MSLLSIRGRTIRLLRHLYQVLILTLSHALPGFRSGVRPGAGLAFAVLILLTSGCGSVQSIQTQQPEAASYEGAGEPTPTVPLVVTLEAASGPLPDAMSSFRFLVGEIHFLAADSSRWTRDANRFEFDLPRSSREPATLVRTHFHPKEIESVAVQISRPYAEFGANAGAPLTVRTSDSIQVAIDEPAPEDGEPYVIRLTFDPDGSLRRDEACRWHFTPRLSGRVDPGALP